MMFLCAIIMLQCIFSTFCQDLVHVNDADYIIVPQITIDDSDEQWIEQSPVSLLSTAAVVPPILLKELPSDFIIPSCPLSVMLSIFRCGKPNSKYDQGSMLLLAWDYMKQNPASKEDVFKAVCSNKNLLPNISALQKIATVKKRRFLIGHSKLPLIMSEALYEDEAQAHEDVQSRWLLRRIEEYQTELNYNENKWWHALKTGNVAALEPLLWLPVAHEQYHGFNGGFFDLQVALLHLAAKQGYTSAVAALLAQGHRVDIPTTYHVSQPTKKKTPLYYALKFGNLQTVQLLLEHGAQSAGLFKYVGWNNNPKVAQCLLEHDSSISVFEQQEALLKAIKKCSHATLHYLLTKNISLNGIRILPLHYAALCANAHAITMLLDAGFDVNAVSDKGNTPLAILLASKNSIECINLLLDAGAKVTPVMLKITEYDETHGLIENKKYLAKRFNALM